MTTEANIKRHLVSALECHRMRDMRREELQQLLDRNALLLSRSVVDHLRWALRSIFRFAMCEGVVDRNPAEALYTPKKCVPAKEKSTLTSEEVKRLLSTLPVREQLIARLAIYEGMRPGEILGLQVQDCGSNSLLRRRVYRGDIDDPKNGRSRQVGLSQGTADLLAVWLTILGEQAGTAWLFASEKLTTPLSRDNVWRRYMLPRLEQVGLEWATFQVLRRTNASLGHQAGVDPKVAADQRGHSVDVSINEYTQASLSQKLIAVRQLEAAMVQ